MRRPTLLAFSSGSRMFGFTLPGCGVGNSARASFAVVRQTRCGELVPRSGCVYDGGRTAQPA